MVEKRLSPEDAQKEDQCCRRKLTKKEIITDKNTIRSLYDNNMQIRVKIGIITAIIVPQEHWGFTIIIKKAVGNAVLRNRIKRVTRAVYRLIKTKINTPYNIIFSVRENPSDNNLIPNFNQLFDTLTTALK